MAPTNPDAFLTEVLARSGAGGLLPYSGEFAFLVHQHLLELVADFPALRLKTQSYTHTDGRTSLLLCAEGTVPMHYGGARYNIPVAIWLPERYPLQRPIVYVVPTQAMIIKPRHRHVDASGLVSSPYLAQWTYPRSSLHEMTQDMCMLFGSDPPLFSKPPGYQPPPPLAAAASGPSALSTAGSSSISPSGSSGFDHPAGGSGSGAYQPPGSIGGSSSFAGGGGASSGAGGDAFFNPLMQDAIRPHYPPTSAAAGPTSTAAGGSGLWGPAVAKPQAGKVQQQQAQQEQAQAAAQRSKHTQESLSAAFRSAAVAELTRRLQASLAAMASQTAAEAQRQVELQGELRRREGVLETEVAALAAERLALDKLAHDLAASNQKLDAWLAENEPRAAALAAGSLDPDDMLTAADPLSGQALEVQAEDLALEDCLYALDKALQGGRVDPDCYLRQVRAVCRRQFTARVLGVKIAAAQQAAARRASPAPLVATQHVSSGGAGGPSPPPPPSQQHRMVLPQGDSWSSTGLLANPLAAAAARLGA